MCKTVVEGAANLGLTNYFAFEFREIYKRMLDFDEFGASRTRNKTIILKLLNDDIGIAMIDFKV